MRKVTLSVAAAAVLVSTGAAWPCRAQVVDLAQEPLPARAFEPSALSLDLPPGDGRRTLAAFPKNLGRNFVGVFSGRNLAPFAIGVAATASASALDSRAQRLLKGSCEPCGTSGAVAGGADLVPLVGALFVAGRFAPQGRFRSSSYDFAQALAVSGAYSGLLKVGTRRERPDGSGNVSFPSGHTASAFSLATVAQHHYGWKAGLPAYALASGIGLSRVEKDKHYLSDVVAGATLGFIVGRTVTRVDGQPAEKKRLLSVGPATDPHGRGLGLGLSASW